MMKTTLQLKNQFSTGALKVNRLLIGFKGQSRVIIPRVTACYECSLDMQTKPKTYPMCTIANTPRLPEHCIEWASQLQWPIEFPGHVQLIQRQNWMVMTQTTLNG